MTREDSRWAIETARPLAPDIRGTDNRDGRASGTSGFSASGPRHAERHHRGSQRRRHLRRHGRRRRSRRRDEGGHGIIPGPAQTSTQGIATLTGLTPGRYTVEGSFPGFETRLIDVRIRAGENKQVLLLPIAGLKDAVRVEQSQQEANVDPRGPSFGTTLTREQLEVLSDDPDVLRQQLQDMAGPGAVIRVDSFEGGALPPKAQIRSIRISRDQFAAENHGAGGTFIEIITQPGIGPIRYNTGLRLRSDALGGRSPFTPTKGSEQLRNYNLGIFGTLVKDKVSFNLFMNGMDSYDTPNINAALASGPRSEVSRVRSPRDNINIFSQADYALTLDQTLRFGYNMFRTTNGNLGIGAYDTEERAYSTENQTHNLRVQHMGPLGRRAATRSRMQYVWSSSDSRSAFELPTIRVNEAFTRGGAQVAGGQHTWALNVASDLDYVRGIHSFRTGVNIDGGRIRSDDATNYLGTYTFESLEAFDAGLPRSYTRRIGDPNINFGTFLGALYVQDDVRIRRNLTLSAGVRYEAQAHLHDYDNVAPRVGFTWSPLASGATTLRSSWGVFYDWLQNSTIEQTYRVDGFHQQELDIPNPPFPEPPVFGSAPPANRYLLADGLRLPRSTRVSAGIDQRLARTLTSTVIYSYTRGASVLRGLNLNAPIDGDEAGSALRKRHRGRIRCQLASASASGESDGESRRAAAGLQCPAHQLEASHSLRELHVRTARKQFRRRVQCAFHRRPRCGVGAGRR